MSPLWGHLVGVIILLMMAVFIGIWVWAWLPRHKKTFGWLARLPMEEGKGPLDDSIPATDEEQRR